MYEVSQRYNFESKSQQDRFARFGWEGYHEMLKYYEVEVIVLYDFIDDIYYQDEQSEDLAVELHKLKMDRVKPKK